MCRDPDWDDAPEIVGIVLGGLLLVGVIIPLAGAFIVLMWKLFLSVLMAPL